MGVVTGFVELGIVILAWTIILNFLMKGITARYSNSPWAQGLAAIFHA